MRKRIAIRLLAALLLTLAYMLWVNQHPRQQPVTSLADPDATPIGGTFSLTDQRGNTVTDAMLHRRFSLVFFGFSNCPDICPTTLMTMTQALQMLGEEAKHFVPVFVTVDPQRDTPEVLREYAAAFDPRLIALTGSPEAIAGLKKQYRVYSEKDPKAKDDPHYLVNHSSGVYLMDRNGQFVRYFAKADDADALAASLKEVLQHER